MNFNPPQKPGLAQMPRLSLMAFIDVVLFILLYFLMAGSLAAPEREIGSALGVERARPSASAPLVPQVVSVRQVEGVPAFVVGQRTVTSRDALSAILRGLVIDQGVFIRAGSDVTIGSIAAAVQAAHDAGFTRISYVPAP